MKGERINCGIFTQWSNTQQKTTDHTSQMNLKDIIEQKESNKRVHTMVLCDSTYKYEAEEQAKILYGDNNQQWLPEVVRLGWKGARGNFLE